MKKKLAAFALFLGMLAGCASSTSGPGAGAAEGIVKGNAVHVSNQAKAVFQQMDIHVTATSTKNSGNQRQITGKYGDSDVTVTVENAQGATSNVKVDASKNVFNGNQSLAQEILLRIVEQA